MNKKKTVGYTLVMLGIAVATVVAVTGWHERECRLANHSVLWSVEHHDRAQHIGCQ
jgi:hypothetical protein